MSISDFIVNVVYRMDNTDFLRFIDRLVEGRNKAYEDNSPEARNALAKKILLAMARKEEI